MSVNDFLYSQFFGFQIKQCNSDFFNELFYEFMCTVASFMRDYIAVGSYLQIRKLIKTEVALVIYFSWLNRLHKKVKNRKKIIQLVSTENFNTYDKQKFTFLQTKILKNEITNTRLYRVENNELFLNVTYFQLRSITYIIDKITNDYELIPIFELYFLDNTEKTMINLKKLIIARQITSILKIVFYFFTATRVV